jgi:hypothetical protein
MDEEIHLSFVIVHSAFGIAQKSPNKHLALNGIAFGYAK